MNSVAIPIRLQEPERNSRAARLRLLLSSPRLEFLLEAHNGISAKIAEEAGFAGIWASGFAMSASLGLPDNNEASVAEMLQLVEYMTDGTDIPVLVDGDTGYGDYNNVQRLVRKLEQRGAAGVCIEDKLFPKRNSFLRGNTQTLASIDEFCGKIRAAKDAQGDDDFVVVARVEALIAGHGLQEALLRAHAYVAAGADAILIHSAKRTAEEVIAFKRAWDSSVPVVVVPTKYYATPTEVLSAAGFSICIWANHLLRASVAAMQRVAKQIKDDQNILGAESNVAPMAEIFRLQDEAELAEAERRYMRVLERPRVVLLAASRGQELGELTSRQPKTMVRIGDKPLLAHIIDVYSSLGVVDVTVVRGYEKDAVNIDGPTYVDNHDFATTGEGWSLWHARESLSGECIIGYGDVLIRKHIPSLLLDCGDDFVICADTQWRIEQKPSKTADLISCTEPHTRGSYHRRVLLTGVVNIDKAKPAHGEWMGILRTSARGTTILRDLLAYRHAEGTLQSASLPDLMSNLVSLGHQIRVIYTTGHWLDVDTLDDVLAATEFA